MTTSLRAITCALVGIGAAFVGGQQLGARLRSSDSADFPAAAPNLEPVAAAEPAATATITPALAPTGEPERGSAATDRSTSDLPRGQELLTLPWRAPPSPPLPQGDPQNPEVDPQRAWLLAEGPARSRENGRRLVALTYDDGPGPHTTKALLDVLDKHAAKATFFMIGDYLEGKSRRTQQVLAAARSVVERGHTVGNHTLQHQVLAALPRAEVVRQIDESARRIEAATGVAPSFFRPPYGGLDAYGSSLAKQRGLTLVLWTVEAQDMVRNDEDAVFEDLRRQIEYAQGGIVLLHDIKRQTVPVTARLLQYLGKRRWDPEQPRRVGFEVVDLRTYLDETAANPQPFASRDELAQHRLQEWRRNHPSKQPAGATDLAL